LADSRRFIRKGSIQSRNTKGILGGGRQDIATDFFGLDIIWVDVYTSSEKVSSQYHRLICSFIRWYGRPMDLPRVIFTLCRFTNGAQRNELKDIHNFYHKWKIRRCSISAHKSTYFFHKKHLFSFTHTYVWFPLIDTSFTYQVLSCTTS
jgi:hypothetical protein